MSRTIDIVVPDLGDFSDVEVIEVLVDKGDEVDKEDGLITLETDKASMDVPAPESGVIESLRVSAGDTVSSGDVIGRMAVAGEDEDGDDESGNGAQESSGDADDDDGEEDASGSSGSDDDGDESGDAGADSDEDDSGGESRVLKVPDIGDFSDVEIIEVHVSKGDEIDVEDALITLETDKASMDVPAEAAGTIEEVLVSEGDKVTEGDDLVRLLVRGEKSKKSGEAGESSKKTAAKAEADDSGGREQKAATKPDKDDGKAPSKPARKDSGSTPGAAAPPVNEAGFAKAHASPSVRKLARELGVDLAQVKGSGPKSRILHDDVKAWVKSILTGDRAGGGALPETPKVDFAKFGEIETQPLTRIQKIAGPRLQASWINLPHVTQHDLADITALEAKRQKLKGPAKERGISLTPLAFIIKAVISALKEFPKVNSSLAEDGEHLVFKKYYHIGFAADTEQGLMVPVIRDADTKDVYEIAGELGELSAAARDGKLKSDQLQGATFTVSSLGGIGGTAFTPIVNAPEVGILGVSRSTMQPVWNGEKFEPRLMLPLSFSYDHRVVDGADAVRFTTFLGEKLGDVDALLEAIP